MEWRFTVFTLNILRSENWKDEKLTQKIRVGKHEYDY